MWKYTVVSKLITQLIPNNFGGDSEIAPLVNEFPLDFFGVIFYPPKHWSIHIMWYGITSHNKFEKNIGGKNYPHNELPRA